MLVDSKQEILSISEILNAAIDEQKVPKKMVTATKLAFIKESGMPDTDVRQFGNTVFISHIKEKNGMKVAFGRPLNADTGKNFLENVEEYIQFLMDNKVNYFVSSYKDKAMDSVLNYIQRPEVQERVGTKLNVKTKPSKDQTMVLVELGGLQ